MPKKWKIGFWFTPEGVKSVYDFFKSLFSELEPNEHYVVTVEKVNPKTLKQLAYIHACLIPFYQEKLGAGKKSTPCKKDTKYYFKILTGYCYNLPVKAGTMPQVKSFADASLKEVQEIISYFEQYSIEEYGEAPPPPKEKL